MGDISKPIVHIEDLDIRTVADFCELFAQVSGLLKHTIIPSDVECARLQRAGIAICIPERLIPAGWTIRFFSTDSFSLSKLT